ncbi:hypothetical protein L195_g034927, partial [Trifolium pratense]
GLIQAKAASTSGLIQAGNLQNATAAEPGKYIMDCPSLWSGMLVNLLVSICFLIDGMFFDVRELSLCPSMSSEDPWHLRCKNLINVPQCP